MAISVRAHAVAAEFPGSRAQEGGPRFLALPLGARLYVVLLWVATAALVTWALTAGRFEVGLAFGALALAWAGLGAIFVVVRSHHRASPTTSVVAVAAILLLPPREAIIVAFLGQLFAEPISGSRSWFKRLFNIANMTLATGAAAGAAALVTPHAAVDGAGALLTGVAVALVFCAANDGMLALALRLAERRAVPLEFLRLRTVVAGFGVALLGVAVAELWQTNGWLLATVAAPLVLGIQSWAVPVLREERRQDVKTALLSPDHFRDVLELDFAVATHSGRPLSVLMADLDHFRRVNSTHGHLAGDAVLVGVADILRRELRSCDTAARFGGEEFAVLLPGADTEAARTVAERVRAAVEAATFYSEADPTPIRATISIGLASASPFTPSAVVLLDEADRALYVAKNGGRNRVAAPLPAA